jgi:hypothetical protein
MQVPCGIEANSKVFHKGFAGIASSAIFLNLSSWSHHKGDEPMHPIIDIAMLKHHRVDYGNRIDKDGAKRPTNDGRSFALVIIAMMAVSVVTNLIV